MKSLRIAAAVAAACVAAPAGAQQYPSKPVRIIVAYTPGGGVDIMARLAAGKLSERMGVQFIVDNRPGAGTIIGTEAVARAAPDGYTLLMANPALAASPALHDKVPYDPVQSFAPVGMFGASYNALVVHPSVPVKTVKQLVALAKSKPGQLNYASAGNGSAIHLAMELFENAAGIDLVHVPYKGAAPAINDVLGGQVTIMFATPPSAGQFMRAGRLRALGVSSTHRLAALPDVPTIAESGYPGFEVSNWYAMVAPAGTPREIIARLNSELNAIIALPEVKERVAKLGNEAFGSTPEEFGQRLKRETETWPRVLAKSKAKAKRGS
jgi:tripartite-type tricarboxylate transporter receptor subunit TctC